MQSAQRGSRGQLRRSKPVGASPLFVYVVRAARDEHDMAVDLEQVRQIAERVTASHGLELVEVEFRGSGRARMLRIFIDKPGGVTHHDCEQVSREVGTILDVEDVVPGGSYVLEVSSPGLDRRLVKAADYQRFRGSLVRITTNEPVNGGRSFEGRLADFQDGRLTIELPAKSKKGRAAPATIVTIDLANVRKANLVPEW